MNLRKHIRNILFESIKNKTLKSILDSDDAYEILDHSKAAGTMWTQGGCAILAFALNKAYGYPVYVIYDKDLDQADHFVVKTPRGTFLDYRGESKDIVNKFKEDEMLWKKDLSLIPYEPGMNISDIVIDDKASQKLAELIKSNNTSTINECLEDGKKNLNRYVYHKSAPPNRKRIEKNGIMPFRGEQWLSDTKIKDNAVFATNSDNPKDWFDSTYDDDVWKIDTTKIPDVKWFMDPNFSFDKKYKHIYTKSPIPINAIELIKKGTGKDLLEYIN